KCQRSRCIHLSTLYDVVGFILCSFFFQAEDGIRDKLVTGVQTCALPISSSLRRTDRNAADVDASGSASPATHAAWNSRNHSTSRSEERRVGKECRCRWSPYQ